MFYFLATILLFAAKSQAQTVAISGVSPLGVNIGPSDSFVVLQCYQLTVTGSSATLTGLSVSTAGTYNSTDLLKMQCWYSTTAQFGLVASPGDLSSAYTLLSTVATPGVAGSFTFPSFVSQTLPVGTSYIFVTVNTSATANTTRNVSIGSTAFSNFSLGSATLTGTNPVPASNTMSFRPFSDPSPYNLTNGDFTLVGWPNSARAKIYPGNGADGTNTNGVYAGATNANIAFHTISNGDPNFTDTAIGDYVGVYNGTSSTRMMGNPGVANGFVWETTGSNLGEAILGLNTTGRDNIYVSWHSETYQHAAATRGYRVRGMYRTGNSGTWQFMPFTRPDTSDITYTGVGSLSPTYADTAYGPIKLPSTCENLPLVQVRWVYYQYQNGTGARPGISVDSIDVTSTSNTATPSIAISNTDPGTNNLSPGSTNNLLQTFHLAVTTHATTINGLSIPVGGTYTTADINNIKLWYSTSSTFNAGTATLLSTITSPATAGTLAFPSFTKGLPVILGGNYYLYVTCDVSSSGTNGHTIRMNSVPFSDFTFSSGTTTGTNPVPTGSVQTILNSVVTLSQTNPTTTAIAPGTTANVLQTYNMAVANAAAVFSGLTITTTGTYATTDVSNIKLWYSSSSTFSTSTATLLSTISSPATAGSMSFPSFSQTMPIGTGYIYVTTDVTTGAATGNTIGIGSESFSNINLGTASTAGTNPVAAATAQTIQNATVTISSTSMSPTTVARSQSNVVLQQYDMVVSVVPAILTGLTFNSAGTYASTDVINFKCWYSTSSTFSTTTATLLSTVASPAAAGAQVFPSFTAQTIPVGTGHIFVTADIYYAATVGNTISAGTTAFSSINFGTATLAGTNPVAANATMTIKTCTDPAPYNLASGVDYTMTNFPTTSAAGTYPSNMVFHCMDAATPTVTANAYNDYTSSYAFGSQTRINALGANGFGFLNNGTSNAPSYYAATTVGEGVLAINTTSRINVNVSWVAGCTAAGTVYNIRGQYRIGTSGAYTDLPNTSLSQIDYTASSIGSQSFGPITLPSTCENQPIVEIRWIYYAPGGGSATPFSYVTNIDVNSSPAPVPMIAVSSTTPAGGNDGQGSTNVLVGGYALAVTNAGTTFTGLTIAEAGTVTSSDVTAVKAWYSTSASFSPGTSTLLRYIAGRAPVAEPL